MCNDVLLASKRVLRNRGSLREKNKSSGCILQACWGGMGLISLAARLSDLVIVCHLYRSMALLCNLVSELRGEIIGWILHIHLNLGYLHCTKCSSYPQLEASGRNITVPLSFLEVSRSIINDTFILLVGCEIHCRT